MASSAPFGKPERMLAWRYLRAKRSEGGISVIAWLSFIGIMLSVGTLIVVMAVMVGFREEFVNRIIGAQPHVQVYPAEGEGGTIAGYDELAAEIGGLEGIAMAVPLIEGQGLATSEYTNVSRFAQVLGLRPDDLRSLPLVADPEEAYGSLDGFGEGRGLQAAVGAGLARRLGLVVGSKITLVTPKARTTALGNAGVRSADFEVGYIFRIGMHTVDESLVYLPFDTAQKFFVMTEQRFMNDAGQPETRPAQASTVAILLDDPDQTEAAEARIWPLLQARRLFTFSWQDANGALIAALNTERVMMFIILSLLVVIAVLNIITGLVMLVKNKGPDIAILRTVGLTRRGVMRVFVMCGGAIGVFGTIAGVIAGVLFALNIQSILEFVTWVLGLDIWDPSVRQLTEMPARLRAEDILATVTLSLSFSLLAALLPAWRASRLDPVEALRNE